MKQNKWKSGFGLMSLCVLLGACNSSLGENTVVINDVDEDVIDSVSSIKNELHLDGHKPFVFENVFLNIHYYPYNGYATLVSPVLQKKSGPPPGYFSANTFTGYLRPIYADTKYVSYKNFHLMMGIQSNDSVAEFPVEATMEEAIEFCNRLSEKHGLEKVYFYKPTSKYPWYDFSKNGFRLLHPLELYCLKSQFENMGISEIEFVGGATGKGSFREEVFSGDRIKYINGVPSSNGKPMPQTPEIANLFWEGVSNDSGLNCDVIAYGYTSYDANGQLIDNSKSMNESKICAEKRGRFRVVRKF